MEAKRALDLITHKQLQ